MTTTPTGKPGPPPTYGSGLPEGTVTGRPLLWNDTTGEWEEALLSTAGLADDAVTGAKIAGGAITSAHVSSAAADRIIGSKLRPLTLISSTSGLPSSPQGGEVVRMRCGSSPYTFIDLVYDDTYAKWVSAEDILLEEPDSTQTNLGTTYAFITNTAIALQPEFYDLYNAGLRPQYRLVAELANTTGGNATHVNFHVEEYTRNAQDSSAVALINRNGTQNDANGIAATGLTASTTYFGDTGWTQPSFNNAPSSGHIVRTFFVGRNSATSAVWRYMRLYQRWVTA
jgi:hypothetical protein